MKSLKIVSQNEKDPDVLNLAPFASDFGMWLTQIHPYTRNDQKHIVRNLPPLYNMTLACWYWPSAFIACSFRFVLVTQCLP
jgi:hypothetical protein